MMKPTVGRVVHYHPKLGVIHAALIAFVHSDTMVNLAAFDGNGNPYGQTSVQLVAPDAPKPEFGSYCEWPAVVPAKPAEQVTITLSKTMGDALERMLVRAEKEMLEQSP
jgi:hypothetical protein